MAGGRLTAAIGFGLGSGISTGISEKRRQDALTKRDRELATAAIKKIADSQKFQRDQLTEQRLFDANLKLQGEIKDSDDFKIDLVSRGMSGSDIDKVTNGGIISNLAHTSAVSNLEEVKISDRNIKFLDLFTKFTQKGTEGRDGGRGLSSGERTKLAKVDPKRDPNKLLPKPLKKSEILETKEEKAFKFQFEGFKAISKDPNASPDEVEAVRNKTFGMLGELLSGDKINNDERFQRAKDVLFQNFKDDSDESVKLFLKNNPDFK